MDIEEIRTDLETRFPQWSTRIGMMRFIPSLTAAPAYNDGQSVFFNPVRMEQFTKDDRLFYMARELLHIQLAHHARGDDKDRYNWRRATNAVADAMLREEGFQLPQGIMLIRDAASQSAEEMYKVFLSLGDEIADTAETGAEYVESDKSMSTEKAGKESAAKNIELEDPGLAAAVAGLAEMLEPSMQMDFDWFPGSTIRDGMLRYDFRPYPVSYAEILLDTSASVDAELLRYFVRGVKALLREDAVLRVGCFDTRFYGFKDINSEEDIENLELQGSGGTDFTVAVNAFTGDAENQIIFTDGYAEMPEQPCNAVWVVYGNNAIHPLGGRVIYAKSAQEKEKHEIDFLIT